MAVRTSQRLVDFLEETAGSALRVAAHYDSDGYEFLYIRDEIATNYSPQEFERHFDAFQQGAEHAETQAGLLDVGNHHCTIHVHDETLILNFTQVEGVKTLVSLDSDAGRDLVGFVTDCLRVIHTEAHRDGTYAPDWVEETD